MSTELRVDPLTGLKVIIAAARAERPGGGFESIPGRRIDPAADPFPDGHEDKTPPEVYAVRPAAASRQPGWSCAWCRTSTRRSRPTARAARPRRSPTSSRRSRRAARTR